jgi:hypothetical protein
MGQAGAFEVVDRGRLDAVVLAQDEAPQERRFGLRCAAFESDLGPGTDVVDQGRRTGALPTRERRRSAASTWRIP